MEFEILLKLTSGHCEPRKSRRRQAETFPLIFSRGAKDAITGEGEGYREKREMAIKPDSSSSK